MRFFAIAVIVGLALISAVWCGQSDPVAQVPERSPVPAPAGDRVTPPAVAPQVVAVAREPSVEAESDAGGAQVIEVDFEVRRGGESVIGERLELSALAPDGGLLGVVEGRPTDVMGHATLQLAVGRWMYRAPHEVARREVLITPQTPRHLALELPPIPRARGTVVDEAGAPVPFAPVLVTTRDTVPISAERRAGFDGAFTVPCESELVQVQAREGSRRSLSTTVACGGSARLTLEEWTRLRVELTGGDRGLGSLFRIDRGDQRVDVEARGGEVFDAPVGVLEVRAFHRARGRLLTGRASVVTRAGVVTSAPLHLEPVQPIQGKVLQGTTPLTGVLVIAQCDRRNDGVAITNSRGEFSLTPQCEQLDPIIELTLSSEDWKLSHRALVRFEDGPVLLEAVSVGIELRSLENDQGD